MTGSSGLKYFLLYLYTPRSNAAGDQTVVVAGGCGARDVLDTVEVMNTELRLGPKSLLFLISAFH